MLHNARPRLLFSLLSFSALTLSTCRENQQASTNHSNVDVSVPAPSFCLIGDAKEQLWSWQESHQGKMLTLATLRIIRPNVRSGGSLLNFPENIRFHRANHRSGKATTFLSTGYLPKQRVLFQRMRCDLPGELDVEIRLIPSDSPVALTAKELQDRQIRHSVAPLSQCWLLPFESETNKINQQLSVRGEGEVLILWHFPVSPRQLVDDWQGLLRDFIDTDSAHTDLTILSDRLEQAAEQLMK